MHVQEIIGSGHDHLGYQLTPTEGHNLGTCDVVYALSQYVTSMHHRYYIAIQLKELHHQFFSTHGNYLENVKKLNKSISLYLTDSLRKILSKNFQKM